jgi:hypothetical protein
MTLRLSTGLQNVLAGINTSLTTNGAFTTVTSGWTASDATLSSETGGQDGNCLRVAETGNTNPGKAYQDHTTKTGHLYKFAVYFKKGTADAGKVMIGTTADEDAIRDSGALTDADWALKTYIFEATATTTRITLQSTDATAGEYSSFDTASLVCIDGSIQQGLKYGEFRLYSGSQPDDPDDVPVGTLLVTIKNGASGITFADASDGVLSKPAAETWSGACVATGTAGWFRIVAPGDLGTDNGTDCRMDGTVATSGGQLNFTSLAFTLGSTQTIDDFQPSVLMST